MSALNSLEIRTTPDLIKLLGQNLYSNPLPVILVRELLQNSRDACLKNKGKIQIRMNVGGEGNDKIGITCQDFGTGMDQDTLFNTFLTIGRTGKKEADSVGGFGIAKVSLFSSSQWSVHTRKDTVSFDGESLSHKEGKEIPGTTVQAIVEVENAWRKETWATNALLMAYSSDVRNLFINDNPVKPYRSRRIIGGGEGYQIKAAAPLEINGQTHVNKVFYRIGGLTQYFTGLGFGGDDYGINVIVDFDGLSYRPTDANYPFNMSRESVNFGIRYEVDKVVAPLAKNKNSTKAEYGGINAGKKAKKDVYKNFANGKLIVNPPSEIPTAHHQIALLWKQVIDSMDHPTVEEDNVGWGLTYKAGTGACLLTKGGEKYLLVNPNHVEEFTEKFEGDAMALVIWIWHLLCHEMTHFHFKDHDEDFTTGENDLAAYTAKLLSGELGKVRVQARKVLKSLGAW